MHSAVISGMDFYSDTTSHRSWYIVGVSRPRTCLKLLPLRSSFLPNVPLLADWPLSCPVLNRLKTVSATVKVSLGKLAKKNTQASSRVWTCKHMVRMSPYKYVSLCSSINQHLRIIAATQTCPHVTLPIIRQRVTITYWLHQYWWAMLPPSLRFLWKTAIVLFLCQVEQQCSTHPHLCKGYSVTIYHLSYLYSQS